MNSEAVARRWTEFVAARPEFKPGRTLVEHFDAGRITRLCDCGCNSYELKVPPTAKVVKLAPPSERGGMAFQLEFNTAEAGKTVGFTVFVDAEGYLSGLDVDYCGNSYPMPEAPALVEPPFHQYGALANAA
jgi:hypothetical protein